MAPVRADDGGSSSGAHDPAHFGAGPVSFSVHAADAAVRATVDAAFADLVEPSASPDHRFVLEQSRSGCFLQVDDEPRVLFANRSGALKELIRLVNRLALDAEPDRLHLHAAAVGPADAGAILLVAPSGVGKSTLAAALALQGCWYLTDEMVSIDRSGNDLRGFPKPLSIRSGTVELLPGLRERCVALSTQRSLVPASSIASGIRRHAQPRAVVVLERADTPDEVRITELDIADAIVELTRQTMDFERFGSGGLEALARLCASAHCLRVAATDPVSTARALLDHLADAPQRSRPIIEIVAPRGLCQEGDGVALDPDLTWLRVDGTLMVLVAATQSVVALDPGVARWCSALLLGEVAPPLEEDVVSALAQIGILEGSS
jgi:hypothetical protein